VNYIGQSQFSDPLFHGSLDEFRIYNYALSAPEVASLASLAPAAPTGLNAAGGNTVVNLSWTQSTSPGISTNKVYRSTSGSGGPYNLLASPAATTSYADASVVNGSTYYYSVSAVNTNGESALSAYAGATPSGVPAAPSGLTATAGRKKITLGWTDNSSNETGFSIEQSTDNVTFGQIATTAANAISYTNSGLTTGVTYYYRVRATNGAGNSSYSNTASATSK
jgi:cellulose 1,4-beta-cellobiosidase